MTRDDLREALAHPNTQAFLAVIDRGEHGPHALSPERYRTLYGGTTFAAPPWEHPRRKVTAGRWTSTAAGRGQFLAATWDALVARYQFPDFSPECQDEAMVALIHGRKALADVLAGRFEEAIGKCAREWASLPGSPYGQPTLTMDEARAVYLERGGTLSTQAPEPDFDPDSLATEHYEGPEPYRYTPHSPKGATMPAPLLPVFAALLPTITQLIPALAAVFKPGSEVAARNVAAAQVVATAITEATQSPNLQAAVERMSADPEAVAPATAAVTAPEVWGLLESGDGGIAAARKAAGDSGQIPAHRNPAVWFMAAFIPLIYAVALLVLTGDFSQDAKMMVITAIFSGLLAAGTAFFLGSSYGSQRKTSMITDRKE